MQPVAGVASRGVKLTDKRSILRALDIWDAHPRLGFVDALTAAYAQLPGMQLATFDTDVDGITGMSHWTFSDPG